MRRYSLIEYTNKHKENLYNLILDNLANIQDCFILDIGCKRGDDLEYLSQKGFKKYYGVDMEYKALEVASKRLNQTHCAILQADGCMLPFKNKSFDIVYSSEVIEHIS